MFALFRLTLAALLGAAAVRYSLPRCERQPTRADVVLAVVSGLYVCGMAALVLSQF